MRLADPLALLLLAALAGWWWMHRRARPPEYLTLPVLPLLDDAPTTPRMRWRHLPAVLRTAGFVLVVVALARPQVTHDLQEIRTQSRNIVLALDISSSMKATDFQPGNRLEVARDVLGEFVRRRDGDLMGLVIFAGRAFLQAPLTPDVELLDEMLERVDIGLLPDGTAIGTALALSLNQLKDLPSEAGVIVLVTDGANNTGKPTPFVAAEAARALGIRIHTIGLSSSDTLGFGDDGFVWRQGRQADRLTVSDEAALRRIAERTGGRYHRATDPEALKRVMAEIDPMERVDIKISEVRDYRELYPFFLVPALALLAVELVVGATWLRRAP